MDQRAFEAELIAVGYTQIETKAIEPRPTNSEHKHDYGTRGIVLDGAFIVTQGRKPTTYLPGEIFAVPEGRSHTEEIGPQGARSLFGRKYATP